MTNKLVSFAVGQTMKASRMLVSRHGVTHGYSLSTVSCKRATIFSRTLASDSHSNLKKFTVPPLTQTLDKFLQTAKPLLSGDQYQHACKLVEEFGKKGGYGEKLQSLLETKARNTDNWLEDWWLNYAYLEFRAPVAIHVNPGILTPRLPFEGKADQLRYAANLICRILDYKKMIDSGAVPVEKLRGEDLCMRQYYRVLGCCRVPGDKRDSVVMHPGGTANSPRHIIVMHNGHIFSLDVYGSNGQPLTSGELLVHLENIVNLSATPSASPVGILTTEHRDKWSSAFSKLCQDPENYRHLLDIQSSIFVLALDNPNASTTGNVDVDTLHLNQMNHGGGSHVNSANRWFDKVLQAVVSPEGRIGFNYEHSAAEGPPVVHLVDACWSNLNGNLDSKISDKPVAPRKLNFRLSADVQEAIDVAASSFDTLVNDLNLIYYAFEKFGRNALKAYKLSPDAFIQVAFQLTFYRLYGYNVATYESGSLRKFRHGRTDTIRSCSQASSMYCRAMVDETLPVSEKSRFLRLAVTAHSKYTEEVTNGNGIDRHLLGLKLIAEDHGLPTPELLTDPVYVNTCNWRISTSQVASRTGSVLCFSPVVPDGYGICYNPMDTRLIFAISSWKSCNTTNARQFATELERSLSDGLHILSTVETGASKL